MPLGPFEMPDDQWALFLELFRWKMKQDGISSLETGFILIKRFWLVINDPPMMQAIVDQNKLDQLLALRDTQDDGRAELDAEIARLEEALGL